MPQISRPELAPASPSRARASNPGPRGAPRTAPRTDVSRRPRSSASGTRRPRAVCNSARSAASATADEQLVGVTHPFHPLFQRQLRCVGKRYNRYGERLLLQADGGRIWSVPVRWTDLGSPDPEVVMGEGRLLLRMADWMQLADLVEDLLGRTAARPRARRKDNYAADVNRITPQGGSHDTE